MTFTIERDDLLAALQLTRGCISTRNTLPILSCVLLRVEGDTLQFTSTDLDQRVRTDAPIKVEERRGKREEALAVSQEILNLIAAGLPHGAVQMTFDAKCNCHLQVGDDRGGSKYLLRGLDGAEFPAEVPTPAPVAEVPGVAPGETSAMFGNAEFTLPLASFIGALTQVSFAASTDTSRLGLQGVLLEAEEGRASLLRFVVTDGRRLAISELELGAVALSPLRLLLPLPAVQFIQRLRLTPVRQVEAQPPEPEPAPAAEEESKIKSKIKIKTQPMVINALIKINEHAFSMETQGATSNVKYSTKLTGAAFPKYQQTIPKQFTTAVTLNRAELLSAVRRAAMFTSEAFASVKFSFDGSSGELIVSAGDKTLGDAREGVSARWEGKSLDITFNPRYLSEPMESLTDETVQWEFNDALAPAVLRHPRLHYIVMPTRNEK